MIVGAVLALRYFDTIIRHTSICLSSKRTQNEIMGRAVCSWQGLSRNRWTEASWEN